MCRVSCAVCHVSCQSGLTLFGTLTWLQYVNDSQSLPTVTWAEYRQMAKLFLIENKEDLKNVTTLLHNLGSIIHFSHNRKVLDTCPAAAAAAAARA